MTEPSDAGPTEPSTEPTTATPLRARRFTLTLRRRRAALATALFAGLAAAGLAGGHTVAELAGQPAAEHHGGHVRGFDDDGAYLPAPPPIVPGGGR